jgi:hypothetical protein
LENIGIRRVAVWDAGTKRASGKKKGLMETCLLGLDVVFILKS